MDLYPLPHHPPLSLSPTRSHRSLEENVIVALLISEPAGGEQDEGEGFISDRYRLQAGRDSPLRYLPPAYFIPPTASRKEKKIILLSGLDITIISCNLGKLLPDKQSTHDTSH